MLNAEMDHHLVAEAEGEAGNHRNGYGSKARSDGHGQAGADDSARSPRALRPGADRQIPAAVCGLRRQDLRAVRARDDDAGNRAHIGELYGTEISPDLVSAVTEAVLEEVVFFDAVR
jgi:putative transposase